MFGRNASLLDGQKATRIAFTLQLSPPRSTQIVLARVRLSY
jgi:hypothetical protein